MDQIHPIKGFSGVAVYHHNTSTGTSSTQSSAPNNTDNNTEENMELDSAGTSGTLPTVNINDHVTASAASEALVVHAIFSTATATSSFTQATSPLSNNSLHTRSQLCLGPGNVLCQQSHLMKPINPFSFCQLNPRLPQFHHLSHLSTQPSVAITQAASLSLLQAVATRTPLSLRFMLSTPPSGTLVTRFPTIFSIP